MAGFSDSEKQQIRNWLGFSELFHDIDPRLEGQMTDLGNRAPDAVTFVQARLADLTDVRTRLGNALDNLDLIKAEDITFLGPVQLEALRDHGRMLVLQIATVFEINPKRDVFAVGEDMGGGLIQMG